MSWTLIIDFGTSSTSAAIADGAGTVELLSFGGVPRLPSVVLASESGPLVVGFAAEQQVGVAPERAERTPKRRLGDAVMLLGSRAVKPVEAVGAVFTAVAEEAIRRQGGVAPTELRLTHPARWGSVRLRALAEAAELAGLPVPTFVAEPVAAAVYFADQDRLPVGSYVAVYDLGGGTFDTAVLQRTSDGFEVVGVPGGDERQGGEAFDDRLFEHIGGRLAERMPDAWEALRFSDERAWRKAGHDLRIEARRAKEALSSTAEYTIYLGAPIDAELVVTREEFEGLIHRDVLSTVDELEATVSRAGLTLGDLAAVNVVGGSSRIPLVTRLVADRIGTMPQTWGDPKAAVVLGAAKATELASVPPVSASGSLRSGSGSASSKSAAKKPLPLPKAVGEYQVLAELGRGGMGVVYLARQQSLGRLVAVKTLPSLDGSLTARLEREAAVLAELQHPHIATVLDIGTDDRGTYVVMPFFAGGTLSQVLDARGSVSPGQAAGVLAAVAEALAATHGKGFLHRDVKPSNVLLSSDGEPYLADYGLAFPLLDSSRMTNSRAVLGTAPYTAPEVIADDQPTPSADLYSLGVTGYQLLAGRLPFSGSNVLAVLDAIRRGAAEPLAEVAPDAPAELVALIAAAMSPEAADRPTDLRAWAAQVRASVTTEPVTPAPPATWAAISGITSSHSERENDEADLVAPLAAAAMVANSAPAVPDTANGPVVDANLAETTPPVADLAPLEPAPGPAPDVGAPPLAALVGAGVAAESFEHAPAGETPAAVRHDVTDEVDLEDGKERPAWQSPRNLLLAGAAALIAVVVLAGVLIVGGGDDSVEVDGPTVEFAQEQSGVATAGRTWTGEGKVLKAEVEVTNPTDAAATVRHVEVIPKSVADSASKVKFDPEPNQVLVDDPVVAFDLELDPGESSTLKYSVRTGVEIDQAKLEGWQKEQATAKTEYDASVAAAAAAAAAPPALDVTAPGEGQVLGAGEVVVEGITTPGATIKVNGHSDLPVAGDGRFSQIVGGLVPGANVVSVVATGANGVPVEVKRNVTVDPSLTAQTGPGPGSVDPAPGGSGGKTVSPPRDTDGDGVTDANDRCRTEAGPAGNKGCPPGISPPPPPPDSDGDGVIDSVDGCRTTAGPAPSGCPPAPDGDGDGFPDSSDRCPSQSGVAVHGGCPKPVLTVTGPPRVWTHNPSNCSYSYSVSWSPSVLKHSSIRWANTNGQAYTGDLSVDGLQFENAGNYNFDVTVVIDGQTYTRRTLIEAVYGGAGAC